MLFMPIYTHAHTYICMYVAEARTVALSWIKLLVISQSQAERGRQDQIITPCHRIIFFLYIYLHVTYMYIFFNKEVLIYELRKKHIESDHIYQSVCIYIYI